MDDEELEKLREKKLREMQEGESAEEEKQEAEAQKKAALRKVLTPDARQRLSNLRVARPEFAESIEQQLIMLAAKGRVQGKIDDEQLKELLKKAQSGKKDVNIRRK